MLRYKLGFAALVALTVGCAIWIVVQVDRDYRDAEGSGAAVPPAAEPLTAPSGVAVPHGGEGDDDPGGIGIPPESERALVTDHVDGDTLRLVAAGSSSRYLSGDQETTVRLLEIDTPESVDPHSRDECYATRASRALRSMLPVGSEVWIKPDRELLDPYDRTLLYLWTVEGQFVNLEMVRGGHARAVLFEPNDEYIEQIRRAESQARANGRGLWGTCESFGQPLGLAGMPSASPQPSERPATGGRTDPRFEYCSDANTAGFGNYVAGRDSEYDWYDDMDQDGIVCEF